ncbi:hypothetical protein Leryth_014369 [Lithospermum erythrorhizon]|nr:hypothetical protein Leryth_014369 [Lithospermum erythrorhizon]
MLSIENPPSCTSEISQLNSSSSSRSDDQEPSGVLQSDLLISCPKFTTIRNHAFSNRSKDINTNWPFSGKSLQLCLDHGVTDLLPPFQSLVAMKPPTAQQCTIATSLVSKESEYHLIDQASRPTNRLLSFPSCDARPSLTSVHTSSRKSEGARQFSSMIVEAETLLNYSASKLVKKPALVANKVENIMKPSTKKCRQMVKLNNTAADQNKLENNTSNNFCVSETMTSNFCPVCKTFTSSSNTTLNAHIDQCLSGKSIRWWTSNPKATKSRVKPRRIRSMVEIYETAQHCTIEELERRNGINLAASSSLPPQDMEVGSQERERKSPVIFEEIENEGDVYVDANGTKLRILSMLTDLSSRVMESDENGDKRSKISSAKKKKKKLQSRVYDSKKFCSPKNHQNSKITGIQEHTNGPEEHLEVEEAFAKPQRTHGLVKYIEPESVCQRACSKRSVLTKTNDKIGHLHPTLTRKKELAGDSPRYSYINGGCGSKSNKSSGTPPASPRSSHPHDDHEKVISLRRNARILFRSEPFNDRSNPLGEVKQRDSRESNSSVKCQNKFQLRNKLNPNASLSVQKKKIKSAMTRNGSSVGETSKHFPEGHDLSSKPRDFSSFTKRHSSRLSNPQASAPQFTLGPKCKSSGLKRRRAYCESESDGEEIMRQTVAKTSDNATISRKAFKVSRDRGKVKVSEKKDTSVIKGMKSTSKHCEPPIDCINDSSSDKVPAGLDDEKGSTQKDVGPSEKDVIVDEETCNIPLFETSEGLCKSLDVQCPEVAGHLDVQSDSSGYMKLCDGTSLGTEDARYPVESVLNGKEKMSYIDEDGKSIFGQNVHAMTELLPNDGSDSYYAEVDLIPIPGPPGSFLPSPSPDEFHGNSAPTSSQDQSSENHREFADRDSSDSPSPTSTISNSDIGKFDSSLNEKLPFRYSTQDVMRSSVSDVTGGTMVNKISPDPSASFAGEGHDPVQPKVDLLYTEMATPLLQNDQPCSCSLEDVAVLSPAVLNYQGSSLLSWPTMPPIPESRFNTQVNSDETRRAKNCNSMLNVPYSGHISGELHYSTGDPLRPIPHKACTDSGVRFTDGETLSPPTSNPVFRLMGKDLMVFKKDETSYSHQTAKEKIFINDASESSADPATNPVHGMRVMNHGEASINPAFMASAVSPMNSISMNSFQPATSHSGSSPLAQTARFQMPPIMGVNPLPIKRNYVAQGSNIVPRGSFQSSPSAARHMWWSTTNHSGGFP